MIDVYKSDLEGIGLGITTMNIADVGGHKRQGVEKDFLYIDLFKEQEEKRRAEVKIRELDSECQNIEGAKSRLHRKTNVVLLIQSKQPATQNQKLQVSKPKSKAEAQRIEMVRAKCETDIIVPNWSRTGKMIQQAPAKVANHPWTNVN